MLNETAAPNFLRITRAPGSATATMPSGRILNSCSASGDDVSEIFYYSSMVILAIIIMSVYPLREASIPDVVDAAVVAIQGDPKPLAVAAAIEKQANLTRVSVAAPRNERFDREVEYVFGIIRSARKNPEDALKLARSIVRASQAADFDPLFIAAVVRAESTFNQFALSYAGARGLMQILPGTGKYISNRQQIDWHASKLSDPDYNLTLGIAYLKELEGKFKGNREHMLIAYNWGPGNLEKAFKGEKRIPGCSVKYAKTIVTDHQEWKKEYHSKLVNALEANA